MVITYRPLVITYLLIPHPDYPRRVLSVGGEEGPSLPAIEIPGWIARGVAEINRKILGEFGFRTTVLRHLHESDFHVVQLEVQGGQAKSNADLRWLSIDRIMADQQHAALVEVLGNFGRIPSTIPWELPGWFTEACTWIGSAVEARGCQVLDTPGQLKGAWGWSTILRVPTSGGLLYFKAGHGAPPREGDVIELLARDFTDHVPEVVAYSREDEWLLMRDFGDIALPDAPSRFGEALSKFAEIQVAVSADHDSWRQIDTPEVHVAQLLSHANELAQMARAGDDHSNCDLDGFIQAVGRSADVLSGSDVPTTVVCQDFRPRNIAVVSGGLVFFDWAETVLAHPFFSALMFLRHCGRCSESIELRQAYLSPWQWRYSSGHLAADWAAARILEPVFVSLWEYRERQHLDKGSPWNRHLERGVLGRRGGRQDALGQVLQAARLTM